MGGQLDWNLTADKFTFTKDLFGAGKDGFLAETSYIVEATENDIWNSGADSFKLNDPATIAYNGGQPIEFPTPTIPKPMAIKIKKEMGQNDQTPTGTKFDMEVTGPTGFTKETFSLGKNDTKTIVKAFPVGSYEITETGINSSTPISGVTLDNYDVSYSNKTFNIAQGQTTDVNIVVTNTYETTTVTASKEWKDSGDQDGKRAGMDAYFAVMDGSTVVDYKEIDILKDTDDFTSKALPKNRNGQLIDYTVVEATGCETSTGCKQISGKQANGYDIKVDSVNNLITNSYTPETVNIAVNKSWKDDNNRDGLRTLNTAVRFCVEGTTKSGSYNKLTCNDDLGAGLGQLVGLQDNILVEFKDLPKYHNKGEEIKYRVYEDLSPFQIPNTNQYHYQADYCYAGQVSKCKYIPNDHLNFTNNAASMLVENKHEPEKRDIQASIEWDDDGDSDQIRPTSIDIELIEDNVATGKIVTVDKNGDGSCSIDWCVTFKDLYVNQAGSAITYTVSQKTTPTGYGVSLEGDATNGFVLKNTHVPTRDVKAIIQWNDNNNQYSQRPAEVEVALYANGVLSSPVFKVSQSGGQISSTTSSCGDWCISFNARKKDSSGQIINYEIKQVSLIPNYATSIAGDMATGFDITNTYYKPVVPSPSNGFGALSPDTGFNTKTNEGSKASSNLMVLSAIPAMLAVVGLSALVVATRRKK